MDIGLSSVSAGNGRRAFEAMAGEKTEYQTEFLATCQLLVDQIYPDVDHRVVKGDAISCCTC